MKAIEEMSIDEVKSEIKVKMESYKKTKPFVFVSYSKRDCDVVYRKVLEWLRMGYNIYIDMDFENHGSDENWITQMKNKIRDNKCVMATVFKSENYCFSYASLIELLTMRSRMTESMRASAVERRLPIDVIELTNRLERNGAKFSSEEIELKYESAFEKIKEKHKEIFLQNNAAAKEAFIEGLDSLAKKIKDNNPGDDTEVSYDIVNENYKMGYTNFYPEIARIVNTWFNSYDLNGNNKSIHDVSGVLSRFKELEVYKNEVAESEPVVVAEAPKAIVDEPVSEKEAEIGVQEKKDGLVTTTKKREASSTGEIKYSLYGEEMVGNQSDLMIMTFGKVLKKHPECIDKAIQEFTCLSDVDYSDKKNCVDMPSYFRVCYTFHIEGKTVCVGTAYGMPDKLKLMAKILMITGEEKDVLRIDGMELPEIKVKGMNKQSVQADKESKGGEVYFISGNRKEGNQSEMMWDVFEALSQTYAGKIESLTTLTCVKQAKDVQDANTKNANPVYFRGCKSFVVNGTEYLVGTSYGRGDKIKQISKMIALCEAPAEFFEIEGESVDEAPVIKKKKEYLI